jgi:hypothetical protein
MVGNNFKSSKRKKDPTQRTTMRMTSETILELMPEVRGATSSNVQNKK